MFTTPTGGPLNHRTDYDEWKRLLVQAGVRDGRLHDARHTAATVLLLLGVPERAVMSLMGWSNCGCFEAEVVEVGSAGRFWGYRGLRPVLAVREVTPDHGIQAGRILRRWYRAKGLTKRVRRKRVDQHTGRVTTRTTTVRKKLFAANRGFVTVNDGPAMASQLARYLSAPYRGRAHRGEQRRRG